MAVGVRVKLGDCPLQLSLYMDSPVVAARCSASSYWTIEEIVMSQRFRRLRRHCVVSLVRNTLELARRVFKLYALVCDSH